MISPLPAFKWKKNWPSFAFLISNLPAIRILRFRDIHHGGLSRARHSYRTLDERLRIDAPVMSRDSLFLRTAEPSRFTARVAGSVEPSREVRALLARGPTALPT